MKNRLQLLMSDKNLTASTLAKMLDVQPSTVSHILAGRNNPNLQFIQKILTTFPDVNPKWLINGQEKMINESDILHKPVEVTASTNMITEISEQTCDSSEKNSQAAKTVEKIVVFYTDKSFVEYRPE